ncbi:hypothetical protein BpHYR1_029173 [Brachionus plicatilis]|uniref:Uncharacterized protein n=1 Tax=Brachionus plicatilis TaxID=10195 RepID=A0A3M7T4A9_BRAPC|nr:hypothetical protein BpHYR1_029173 [Brachionus plicatilis]
MKNFTLHNHMTIPRRFKKASEILFFIKLYIAICLISISIDNKKTEKNETILYTFCRGSLPLQNALVNSTSLSRKNSILNAVKS